MILLFIVLFVALGLFDIPKLLKTKKWRELIVYSLIMAYAFVQGLLLALDLKAPNPASGTIYAVGKLFEKLHLTYK